MMRQTVFTVHGDPAPQGSKRAFYNKKTQRVNVVEDQHSRVRSWRGAVAEAVRENVDEFPEPFEGAVEVKLRFMLRRPKGHFGTGRNKGMVKASAPEFPAVQPDVDKLARSTLDGLVEAGLLSDDKLIVSLRAEKRYTGVHPHCDVTVREAVE